MKIGISCYPTFGGSGVVASELGMALSKRHHEVHFISYAVPGRLNVYRPGIFYHKVSVPDYPLFEYPPYSLALASHMSECAKREKLDLIHAHYAIPHAASAILARDMADNGLKVATTLHGTDITLVGRDDTFLPITRYAIEKSDVVSAVSKFLVTEVCNVFTCEKDVKLIYNFIDPDNYKTFKVKALREIFAPDGEKLLIHVSNFRPLKRTNDVLEVFLRIRRKMPTKLILIGQGPDLPLLQQNARKHNAERDLIVLGNRETVNNIMSVADLLLLPSENESFGLVALEAMASGTPPITTNVGGLPEVIRHGKNGLMFDVGDVDSMAEAGFNLLSDSRELSKLSKHARAWAFDNFHIDKALDAYEEFYREAMDM